MTGDDGKLAAGWVRRPLGEVVVAKYGKALPQKERHGGAVGVYGSNGQVGAHDEAITDAPVIVVGRKGSVGAINYSNDPVWPIDTTYFIDDFSAFEPQFLRRLLESLHLDQLDRSTAIPGLSRNQLYEQEVVIPPRLEQRAIAARLDDIEARRASIAERLAEARRIVERLRGAVLSAACSGSLTNAWREQHVPVGTAEELASRIASLRRESEGRRVRDFGGGHSDWTIPDIWEWTTPEQLRLPNRSLTYGVIKLGPSVEEGVPTLRSSDVRWLRIETDRVKPISRTIADQYRRTYLAGGEVVVTVRGTLGGVAVVPPKMAGWNVSREVAVLPLVGEVDALFVACMIGSPQCQRWLAHVAKGVAYTGVNIADLKELPLPLPPLEEQRQIVSCVTEVLANADRLDAAISAANAALDGAGRGALAKAFRGELVVAGADPTS